MLAIGYPLIPDERSVARIKSEPLAQMDERFVESVLDRSMLHSRRETERKRKRGGKGGKVEARRGRERERIFLKRGGMDTSNE